MTAQTLVESKKKLASIPDFLSALRSGKYKQGYELVDKKERGLCALGVWAHISD